MRAGRKGWLSCAGLALVALPLGCSTTPDPSLAVTDASVDDARADGASCVGDAGALLIGDDSPLASCPGRSGISETPQVGLCPPGQFPDIDVTCGPPFHLDDGGGQECGCKTSGSGACRARCTCDVDCAPEERCTLRPLFWGSDVIYRRLAVCTHR